VRYPELEPLLTTKDVARYFGLSASRLERWRCYGGGPPWINLGGTKGGAVRYRLSEVQLWLAANTVGGGQ